VRSLQHSRPASRSPLDCSFFLSMFRFFARMAAFGRHPRRGPTFAYSIRTSVRKASYPFSCEASPSELYSPAIESVSCRSSRLAVNTQSRAVWAVKPCFLFPPSSCTHAFPQVAIEAPAFFFLPSCVLEGVFFTISRFQCPVVYVGLLFLRLSRTFAVLSLDSPQVSFLSHHERSITFI